MLIGTNTNIHLFSNVSCDWSKYLSSDYITMLLEITELAGDALSWDCNMKLYKRLPSSDGLMACMGEAHLEPGFTWTPFVSGRLSRDVLSSD